MSTGTEQADREESRCPIRPDYQPYSVEGLNDPLGMIKPMRQETPVFFCPQTQMWIISRHDDVLLATRDTTRFSSNAFRQADLPQEALAWFADGVPPLIPSLINSDPPPHKRVRKLANQSFTRSRIEAMRPTVHEQVEELLVRFVDRGHCELISEFTAPLPAAMFADILEVPRDRVDRIMAWGDAMMVTVGTMMLPPDETLAACRDAVEFKDWCLRLIAERRANPRDADFMTDLVTAQDGDEPMLTDDEILSMMSQFIVAGHETTRHLIASTIHLLIRTDQLDMVRDNPDLVENAIEETLRHSGPTKGFFRRTTEDVEIGGATIPAGDYVQIMFSSANRDERAWDDPDRYDVHREGLKRHVAFGIGEHFCIGAPLARLQASIAIPELLRRLPGLRFKDGVEPHARIPSLSVSGLQRLDVEWDLR
jgi:cytochrome P450